MNSNLPGRTSDAAFIFTRFAWERGRAIFLPTLNTRWKLDPGIISGLVGVDRGSQ